jgi:GYF domain 2/Domain of unknown function (DUF4190)
MNWFYSKDGQQQGPVAFSEIERLLAEGQITEDSLVWQQGSPNWVKLSTVLNAPPVSVAPGAPATPISAASTETIPAVSKTNGFAITSLTLGIIGLFCCTTVIFNILAVIFGHIALNQLKLKPTEGGRNLALAGLIMGYLGLALGIATIIYMLLMGIPASSAFPPTHHP